MRAIEQLLNELGNNKEEVLLLIREMSESVAYYRRLLEGLELDALTGLPGSNKFHRFIADIENHAASLCVIFFDVNGLKYYNDNKGHQAGDLLLQKAAESIIFISGGNIHSFRVGGDEFVVIAIDYKENEIDDILTKWRGKLAELNKANDGIHCSVAVGAAFGDGEYKISDILKLADERMYEDKRKMKGEI
jgi:diguanylate cyclase (GGDEF)-like protein